MVWFQCEDCGDNLKKPKLANHFRVCSANKLSCIDCGQIFGQQSVQGHTQCITETEKYGPKGQSKPSNGTPGKPNSSSKPKPEVDINVGLSERPPWFCSLCNTSATSRQTLLLHADGKKHRAKARAFHASKQPPKQPEDSTPKTEGQTKNITKDVKEPHTSENKKRKLETSESNGATQQSAGEANCESGHGEVIQVANAKSEKTKKPKHNKEDKSSESKENGEKEIKWKKIITSVLRSNPDATLKMRKLRKQVLKTLRECGSTEDENQLIDKLEQKINSSSKFIVNGKYVQLVNKT